MSFQGVITLILMALSYIIYQSKLTKKSKLEVVKQIYAQIQPNIVYIFQKMHLVFQSKQFLYIKQKILQTSHKSAHIISNKSKQYLSLNATTKFVSFSEQLMKAAKEQIQAILASYQHQIHIISFFNELHSQHPIDAVHIHIVNPSPTLQNDLSNQFAIKKENNNIFIISTVENLKKTIKQLNDMKINGLKPKFEIIVPELKKLFDDNERQQKQTEMELKITQMTTLHQNKENSFKQTQNQMEQQIYQNQQKIQELIQKNTLIQQNTEHNAYQIQCQAQQWVQSETAKFNNEKQQLIYQFNSQFQELQNQNQILQLQIDQQNAQLAAERARADEQIDQNNTEVITPKIQSQQIYDESNKTQIFINLNKFPEDTGLKLIKQLQKHIPTIIKAEPENKNVIVTVKATDAEDAVYTIRTMKIQGIKLQCELLNNETIMVEESESSSVVIEVSADDKM
ncbi:Hypothetical_protein [Hexamita inflata]|uniref:Hypothetical_protein n=1 Tax=Hexamita inflata TaxID=28002 RepID=A0AA86UKN5_9EUKA|nr:Hypothetical protein HINF_LOCUS30813 [Hexamita inflata]